ncbi:MAG: AAA family ATPase [Firmicutes bacterium]|nr:AAA family ATPase [Bacillota bacterium]
MKIAITGKGGVGKTTFASILCQVLVKDGYKVFAVDADPDANFGLGLGFSKELLSEIVPITKMQDLISERTNSKPGSRDMFKLNPKVDDLPDIHSKVHNGVKLLTIGTVESGGSGCFCPQNTFVKRLLSHIVLDVKDVVVMDMEAGIEHIGRGIAEAFDVFIVVVEPGIRSIKTYQQVKDLAKDIGVKKVVAVGNKIKNQADKDFILSHITDCLGFITYRGEVSASDRYGSSAYDASADTVKEVVAIKQQLFK